jgi:hypothetical protein
MNVAEHQGVSIIDNQRIKGPKIVRIESMDNITASNKRIKLRSVDIEIDGFQGARIFSSHENAKRHIRKHILGHGECKLWSNLCKEISHLIDIRMSTRSGKFVDIDQIQIGEIQQLYESYSKAIESELRSSVEYGTVVVSGDSKLSVGLGGSFIVVRNNVIRTAYFPTWSSLREHHCTSFIHSKKRRRDKDRRIKARNKLTVKGSNEKQLFRLGIKATHRLFANVKSKDKDFKLKKELACLIGENIPLTYTDWKDAYLAQRHYDLMEPFVAA